MRIAEIARTTNETDIAVKLFIDGSGKGKIDTSIGFFDHMMTLFKSHGKFDLNISCKGDVWVDYHHRCEDIGIALGEAFAKALREKRVIIPDSSIPNTVLKMPTISSLQ